MSKRAGVLFTLPGLLALSFLAARAQEPKPKAPEGIIPSAYRAFIVTDGRYPPIKLPSGKVEPDPRNRIDKIHCLVCENGLAPVIGIFVRDDVNSLGADKGVAELIKKVDALIPKHRGDKLAAFVMFLALQGGDKVVKLTAADGSETQLKTDIEYPDLDYKTRDKAVADIRNFASALNTPNVPFGLATNKSRANIAWGLEEESKDDKKPEEKGVTVISYYHMRRINTWKFPEAKDLTEDKIKEIIDATESAIRGKK
jgi:hypothetical protein